MTSGAASAATNGRRRPRPRSDPAAAASSATRNTRHAGGGARKAAVGRSFSRRPPAAQTEEESDEDDEGDEGDEDERGTDVTDDDGSDASEEDVASSSDGDDEDEEDREREALLRRLRKALKQVPLGELAEIQRKVGVKAFTAAAAEGRAAERLAKTDPEGGEAAEAGEERRNGQRRVDRSKVQKEKKAIPRRSGKNRPVEMSAKRPVSRFRQVVEVKASKRRDPRFEPLSGRFNADSFAKNYSFLEDYRTAEKDELKKRISKAKDPEEKERFRKTLTRMESQEKAGILKRKVQEIKREHRRRELDLVKAGKAPYFLKRSEQKKLLNIARFKAIAGEGGAEGKSTAVDKSIEKKRKRNAAKERRRLPRIAKRRKTAQPE